MHTLIRPSFRWLVRSDLPRVLEIEQQSFPEPWDADDFRGWFCDRNTIGIVAEAEGRILGYCVYSLGRKCLEIVNLAVAPEFRRQQVGTQMVERLLEKLHSQRLTCLTVTVSERNVTGQLFFRSCGLVWFETLRGLYEARYMDDQDAYRMAVSIEW